MISPRSVSLTAAGRVEHDAGVHGAGHGFGIPVMGRNAAEAAACAEKAFGFIKFDVDRAAKCTIMAQSIEALELRHRPRRINVYHDCRPDQPWTLTAETADPALVSIQPQMLHEAVVSQLSRMIIEGALAPGTRLNERMLCDKLGVSRTPLREAFRVLAAQGLVALLPNRGAVVPELDNGDIAETFEVIAAWKRCRASSPARASPTTRSTRFARCTIEMLACHAVRDLPGYYRLNREIHDAINRAARNDVLRQTYTTINSRLQALRFRSNFDRDKWDVAVREHSRHDRGARRARRRAARSHPPRARADQVRLRPGPEDDGARGAPRQGGPRRRSLTSRLPPARDCA